MVVLVELLRGSPHLLVEQLDLLEQQPLPRMAQRHFHLASLWVQVAQVVLEVQVEVQVDLITFLELGLMVAQVALVVLVALVVVSSSSMQRLL
jgi:hypothetical protein